MKCTVCKDSKTGLSTGSLELVRSFSFTILDQGVVSPESAVCIDEYLSCNSCSDPSCPKVECSTLIWAEDTKGGRRIYVSRLPTMTAEALAVK